MIPRFSITGFKDSRPGVVKCGLPQAPVSFAYSLTAPVKSFSVSGLFYNKTECTLRNPGKFCCFVFLGKKIAISLRWHVQIIVQLGIVGAVAFPLSVFLKV
mgnify:CR=1 FL=1